MTGEKTLPVLEAAHIRPFSEQGPHLPSNGLLLRADLHTLFDRGLMTVTADNRIEVSGHIKETYGNGRHYYKLHGQELQVLPENVSDRPSREFVEWHNSNVFRP
jgi:putative restriction endonuclease